ncbi:MAG: hypothetical protein AAF629_22125 [Chloroflexota bacterium]
MRKINNKISGILTFGLITVWVTAFIGQRIQPASTPNKASANSSWQIVHTFNENFVIHDIAPVSPTNVWAVGHQGVSSGFTSFKSLILHYDGVSWQTVPSSWDHHLNAIAMIDENTGWAVGDGGLVLQYQNGIWQEQVVPAHSHINLRDISIVTSSDIWVVGDWIMHYDGSTWSVNAVDTEDYNINAIDMISTEKGWTAGFGSAGWTQDQVIQYESIHQFDGSNWQPTSNSGLVSLLGLDMVSDNQGWAVGRDGAILHFDGTSWRNEPSPTTSQLNDIGLISAQQGWAVGENGTLLSYDGLNWISNDSPTTKTFYAVALTTGDKGQIEGWASAQNVILHYSAESNPSPLLIDALGQWSIENPYGEYAIYGLDLLPNGEIWAVGKRGSSVSATGTMSLLMHFNGTAWQRIETPYAGYLEGISMINPQEGWAVGQDGLLLRFQNGQWVLQSPPTSNHLHEVVALSADDVWVVGDFVVLHYDGQTWQEIPGFIQDRYHAIDMLSAQEGWILSRQGISYLYNGTTWIKHSNVPLAPLAVDFVSSNEGWAVGSGSSDIAYYNGSVWTLYPAPQLSTLRDITMIDEQLGFAVGDRGGLLIYKDQTWQPMSTPLYRPLYSVDALRYEGNVVAKIGAEDGAIFNYESPKYNAKLSGRVLHPNGLPANQRRVLIQDAMVSNTGLTVDTNVEGIYQISGLPNGEYRLSSGDVNYDFKPQEQIVNLPSDTQAVDFVILPKAVSATITANISTTLTITDTQSFLTQLTVGANTMPLSTTIIMTPTIVADVGDLAFAGHAFELSFVHQATGSALFTQTPTSLPFTLTHHYSDQDVRIIRDLDQLSYQWWDGSVWRTATDTCVPPTDQTLDKPSRILTLPICRSGLFALFGPTNRAYLPLLNHSTIQ